MKRDSRSIKKFDPIRWGDFPSEELLQTLTRIRTSRTKGLALVQSPWYDKDRCRTFVREKTGEILQRELRIAEKAGYLDRVYPRSIRGQFLDILTVRFIDTFGISEQHEQDVFRLLYEELKAVTATKTVRSPRFVFIYEDNAFLVRPRLELVSQPPSSLFAQPTARA